MKICPVVYAQGRAVRRPTRRHARINFFKNLLKINKDIASSDNELNFEKLAKQKVAVMSRLSDRM